MSAEGLTRKSPLDAASKMEPKDVQPKPRRKPKDEIEDQLEKVAVAAPIIGTIRVGYLLFFMDQLASSPYKGQRSDHSPELQQAEHMPYATMRMSTIHAGER